MDFPEDERLNAADVRPRHRYRRGAAAEGQRELDLVAQKLEHLLHAVSAGYRKTPQRRPSGENGLGSQRKRLDDVGPAADASVHEHDRAVANRFDDLGERIQ